MLNGQINLRDAVRRQIDFETGGKKYKLVENPAVLIVRYAYVLHVSLLIMNLLSIGPGVGILMNFVLR